MNMKKDTFPLKMFIIFVLLSGLLHGGGAVDCNNASGDLLAVEDDMTTYEQEGTLCSHTRSLIGRILKYESCQDVAGRTADLWNKLLIDCPDSIRDAQSDIPYACRKERCMITPDLEGEYNATETDDGGFEFDEIPTGLLNDLLGAFGRAGVDPGASNARQASVKSSNERQTLFDQNLLSVATLLTGDGTKASDFDPVLVCEIMNKLDIERMLQCVVNQKVLLRCDGDFSFGQEYNVPDHAQELKDICSKACINLPPEPYYNCQTTMSYSEHLKAIENAVASDTNIDQACSNMQETYFDCLTETSRCCDPLLNQLDELFEHFVTHQYGGQTCTNVQLNKMTDCAELQEDDTTDEPNDDNNDNDDNGNPDTGPVRGGNGAKGVYLSFWMLLLLVSICLFH